MFSVIILMLCIVMWLSDVLHCTTNSCIIVNKDESALCLVAVLSVIICTH